MARYVTSWVSSSALHRASSHSTCAQRSVSVKPTSRDDRQVSCAPCVRDQAAYVRQASMPVLMSQWRDRPNAGASEVVDPGRRGWCMAVSRRTAGIGAAAVASLVVGGVIVASQGSLSNQPAGARPTSTGPAAATTTPDAATPTATPTPTPTAPPPLQPNMQVLPASEVSLRTDGRVRHLRFATTLVNVGSGPLELRPDPGVGCPPDQRGALQWTYLDADRNGAFDPLIDTAGEPSPTGCMLFHPTHDHWHFDASARYVLLRPGSPEPIVSADKVSFCMRDSDPLPGAESGPETYGECTRDSVQGISTGWLDVYEARLDGQALPLPPDLPDGPYCLQMTVDPFSLIRESVETDNVSVTGIQIQGRAAVPGPPPPGCGA
jgi:hypothetical protein